MSGIGSSAESSTSQIWRLLMATLMWIFDYKLPTYTHIDLQNASQRGSHGVSRVRVSCAELALVPVGRLVLGLGLGLVFGCITPVYMNCKTMCVRVRVCVRVRTLKGKWLELSTPKSVHIYSMAVALHVLTRKSKGQRSRSHGYENRHGCVIAWLLVAAVVVVLLLPACTARRMTV